MNKLKQIIVTEAKDYKILLRNAPTVTMIFFTLSVVLMNIFASKELLNIEYLALDCGFLLSWMSFLCMDMLTKRFGARAAIKLSLFAVFMNLICSGIFFIISRIGNNWSVFYDFNDNIANDAVNGLFGGTWYVLVGSMTAFIVSAIVNAIINDGIGKLIKKKNFFEYAMRSYFSTAIGQFVDNFVFATIVSKVFFEWTWTQVVFCSIAGAAAELLSEVVFSPLGFKVCKRWEKEEVGKDYIDFTKEAAKT
jgi:uncharacterized integral membrane protein (TIGR00697 family)